MTFDFGYALEILPVLSRAAVVTVLATFGGFFVAVVLGFAIAVARRTAPRAIARIIAGFVEFVRVTPLLVQLYLVFFVLPHYGLMLDALTTGILALGLHYSTYISEVVRAGIEGVPRGQWEAATALGLTRRHTWLRIVLPQATRRIVPPLGNYLIGMFKTTPYLAFITIPELLSTALSEAGRTYRYFEPITIVGLIFILLSYPSALVFRRLEMRLANA